MNRTQPLVSVIMPAYNAGKYIGESILSVLNQSYQNWELIIINDGSTDSTTEIVQQFLQEDKRIHLLHNETNRGLIFTRNRGLERAKGKYIANLDSDDIALPDRLSKQVEFLENHEHYAMIGSACIEVNGAGEVIKKIPRDIADSHLKTLLLFSNYFINSSVLFRASIVKKLSYQNGFAPAEDYELFSQIAELGEMGNLNEPLIKYRVHNQNISALMKVEQQNAIAEICRNQLIKMGMSPTANELNWHTKLVDGEFDESELTEVQNWLIKLIAQNDTIKKYPKEIFNYYCAFFYRRACENSNLGLKGIFKYRKSSLSKYNKGDIKGNSIFFAKSLFKI